MKRAKRTFSAEFKAKVAIEAIKEIQTISELAQIYQVHPNQISLWKKEFLASAGKVFEKNKQESDQIEKLKKENDELIHQIGKLTVDINWLKKKVL
jgi:transposase